jgi:hypothetical protein
VPRLAATPRQRDSLTGAFSPPACAARAEPADLPGDSPPPVCYSDNLLRSLSPPRSAPVFALHVTLRRCYTRRSVPCFLCGLPWELSSVAAALFSGSGRLGACHSLRPAEAARRAGDRAAGLRSASDRDAQELGVVAAELATWAAATGRCSSDDRGSPGSGDAKGPGGERWGRFLLRWGCRAWRGWP